MVEGDDDDEDPGGKINPKSYGAADWTPSLKNYVSRCFNQCVTDVDKDMVEVILKGKIIAAASSNTLWTKNWDSEPLPSNLSNSKVQSHEQDIFMVPSHCQTQPLLSTQNVPASADDDFLAPTPYTAPLTWRKSETEEAGIHQFSSSGGRGRTSRRTK